MTLNLGEENIIARIVTIHMALIVTTTCCSGTLRARMSRVEDVISVAGTWGYAATTPHDIRQACLIIANNMYKKRHGEGEQSATLTPAGVVLSPAGMPTMAAKICRRYKRRL